MGGKAPPIFGNWIEPDGALWYNGAEGDILFERGRFVVRKVRTWLQNEISGWKKWEVVWLITACAIIVALSIYWQDTWMGILSATTGAACVICTGKGKLSAYVFGLVNSVLYAIISYQAAL